MTWARASSVAILLLLGAAALASAGSANAQIGDGGLVSFSGLRSIPSPLLGDNGPAPSGSSGSPQSGASGDTAEDEPLEQHGTRASPDTGTGFDVWTALAWLAPAGLIALAGVAVARHRRPDVHEDPPERAAPPQEPDETAEPGPFLAKKPPPGVDGLLTVAQAHIDAGDMEEAVRWFEMAVAIKPRLRVAHFCMGLALEGLGRDEEALEAFERTDELGAMGPAPVYRQARVLARMGRSEEAFQRLSQALQAEPELRDDAADDPVFERFQDHPRFLALLGQI